MLLTQVYGFSASKVGLSYLAPSIGSILAIGYAGYADQKFFLWQTRRKNGVREPEDRLWLLLLMAVLMPTALILWGVGAARQIHWMGLMAGTFLIGFCNPPMGSMPLNYTIDSYKDLSGEMLLTIMLIRNSLSFGIGYAITPWLNMGLQNTFIVAAFASMVVLLSFLIMVKWGKSFRNRSKTSYWKYVESSVMPHH
jgi:MFS family permease